MGTKLFLAFLSFFVIAGCGEDEPAKKIDWSKREDIIFQRPAAAVTYAYLPQYAHTTSYQRHHQLVEYLSRATGYQVVQVFPDTFDEHINMVARGLIDISFVNPFIYVKLADQYGARPLARIVEATGQMNFRGQIICRSDNRNIKTLADLKGKRLIAVDPSSAGGYLFPWGFLWEQGFRKNDFAEIAFAPGPGGKQEKVVMAVYSGKYDVGIIREGTLDILAKKIDLRQIRVLAHSPWYPGWLFASRQGLEPAKQKSIQEALLALNPHRPEDRAILEKAGFVAIRAANDADFDPVRRLAALVAAGEVATVKAGSSPSRALRSWDE